MSDRSRSTRSPHAFARAAISTGKLDNGAGWSVWHEERDPVLSLQIWIRVGSSHEAPGKTGLAHMLEHLMFRGTKRVPDGAFDARMESRGASTNAATWLDFTCYTATVQTGALAEVLELEADRLANLALTEEVFHAERSVVANERREVVDANPDARLHEAFQQRSLGGSPYGWPTIGWAEDIAAFTLRDVRGFYRRHYAPGRLHVVLCGPVASEEALPAIRRTMGRLRARPAGGEPAAGPTGAPCDGEMRLPLSAPRLLAGWIAPGRTHRDFPAWQMMHELLSGGDSSRLPERLEFRERIVLDVATSMHPHRLPGLFELHATLRPGVRWERVVASVRAELGDLAERGPGEEELRVARRRVASADAAALATTAARAEWMGESWIAFGNPTDAFRLCSQLERVTPEAIRRIARGMLRPERWHVLRGVPEASPWAH